jgi:hypothetical protein
MPLRRSRRDFSRSAPPSNSLVEIRPAAFAHCKISSRNTEAVVTHYELARQIALGPARKFVKVG